MCGRQAQNPSRVCNLFVSHFFVHSSFTEVWNRDEPYPPKATFANCGSLDCLPWHASRTFKAENSAILQFSFGAQAATGTYSAVDRLKVLQAD